MPSDILLLVVVVAPFALAIAVICVMLAVSK